MRPAKYPKDVMFFLYDPDRKFVNVLVELKNEPGAIYDVASRVLSLGLNILNGLTSVEPGQKVGTWSFFAEPVDKDFQAAEAKRVIGESKYVLTVRVEESEGGLLTDAFHFPLRFTPGRIVVAFNPTVMASMFRRIIDAFGKRGEAIVYGEGKVMGKEGGKFLLSIMGRRSLQSSIGKFSDLLSGWGWGLVESIEMDEDLSEVRIRTSYNFESSGARSAKPTCHFIRGMLEGVFETVANHPMSATETTCASQGRESCEFTIIRR